MTSSQENIEMPLSKKAIKILMVLQ